VRVLGTATDQQKMVAKNLHVPCFQVLANHVRALDGSFSWLKFFAKTFPS
jgi:hypothetical protein